MEKYEYVPKSEYQPLREDVEEIIKRVQVIVRKKFTFTFHLIGSGKKHLITRVVGGNKGFDLDYNLKLNNPSDDKYWEPEFARTTIFDAFQEAIKGTDFTKCEDSTSSICIKCIDKKNSKIVYSADFAVVCFIPSKTSMQYVKRDKSIPVPTYSWQPRKYTSHIDDNLNYLKYECDDYWYDIKNDYWTEIKNEYLKVKNKNKDKNKHSFQLFYEAVNNVVNQANQFYEWLEEQDEDDDYWNEDDE